VAPCEAAGSAISPAPASASTTPNHLHRFLTISISSPRIFK
jgi:hypothetical protein